MTDPTSREVVHSTVVDYVAILTIDRPEAMNSVDTVVSTQLGCALARADADPDVRVVVVTGTGRAFCAGADLKAIGRGERLDDPRHPERGFAGYVQHRVSVPTIAAVNGFALGGGTEIVLASDLAVIDENASLGLPEVTRGLMAAAGGVLRIQRQIPLKLAMEVALTGRAVPAAEAHAWGLVNRVAPGGTALDVALDLARSVAANAPLSVRETKRMIQDTLNLGSDWGEEIWAENTRTTRRVFGSDDAREGTQAFAEKRAPAWSGR